MKPVTVAYDAYFLLTCKWKSGFTHVVPCRGYNLKSQLQFTKSLTWIQEYSYTECTAEEYNKRVFGIGEEECQSQPVADTKSRSKKSTTSPPKAGRESAKEQLPTKASAKNARKPTKKTTKSSTMKAKN